MNMKVKVSALIVFALLATMVSLSATVEPAEASTVKCTKQSWTWSTICVREGQVKSPTYNSWYCRTWKDKRSSLNAATSVTSEVKQIANIFGVAVSAVGYSLYYSQKLVLGSYIDYQVHKYCTYWTHGVISRCTTNYYATCTPSY